MFFQDPFVPKDLVIRSADVSCNSTSSGKLAPNWEGSYTTDTSLGNIAYIFETLTGDKISFTWITTKLKVYTTN